MPRTSQSFLLHFLSLFLIIVSSFIIINLAQVTSNPKNPDSQTVLLYYYNSRLDPQSDCLESSVVPVQRLLPATQTPISDTLRLLISGQLTSSEESAGFTTEFPYPGFQLLDTNLADGTLTLKFTDVPGFTTGGACRTGLLRTQVIKTALQFPQVREIIFDPEVFQP